MAQYAVLSHPDVAQAGLRDRKSGAGWSSRLKLACFLGCAIASWAVVLAPFFLIR